MRPCWVEIDTQALEDNYRFLVSRAPSQAEPMAVVKADAYGHSLNLCAPAAVRAGARYLGVTSIEEAVAARAACPDASIVPIGGVFLGQGALVLQHRLTPVVWEESHLDELETAARSLSPSPRPVPVHLEIDTGMSRQGITPEQLARFLARVRADSPFYIEAVMTHLYASDDAGGEATAHQLHRLEKALSQIVQNAAVKPQFLSVGASAALLGTESSQIATLAQQFRLRPMFRLGLALYGVVPRFHPSFAPGCEPASLTVAETSLRPVLAWKTRVISVRDIQVGTEIGYNGTFVASEPMRLALLALGYADGFRRSLGNRFSLLVRGQRAPVVGRVSMDHTVIDVTEIPSVEPGDDVVILGSQGGESITAYDHAEATDTIPWEVFTSIAVRVYRVSI